MHTLRVCVWRYLCPPHQRFSCFAVCFEALEEHCCGTRSNLGVNRLVSFDKKIHSHLEVTDVCPIYILVCFFPDKKITVLTKAVQWDLPNQNVCSLNNGEVASPSERTSIDFNLLLRLGEGQKYNKPFFLNVLGQVERNSLQPWVNDEVSMK